MKRLFAALSFALLPALASAQGVPGLITYGPSNPTTTTCRPGYLWWNTVTDHLWICDTTSWVDMLAAATATFPFTETTGSTTATLDATTSGLFPTISFQIANVTEGAGFNAGVDGALGAGVFMYTPTKSAHVSVDGTKVETQFMDPSGSTTLTVGPLLDSSVTTDGSFTQTVTSTPFSYLRGITNGTQDGSDNLTSTTHNVAITDGVGSVELGETATTGSYVSSRTVSDGAANSVTEDASVVAGEPLLQRTSNNGTNSTTETVAATGPFTTTTGAQPTCDATTRGHVWRTEGGVGVKDTYEVCLKDSTNTYAWRSLVGVLP